MLFHICRAPCAAAAGMTILLLTSAVRSHRTLANGPTKRTMSTQTGPEAVLDLHASIRSSSRGPFSISFSCLPAFTDGRMVCGGRNPMLIDESAEKLTEGAHARRVEAFTDGDHGRSSAQSTAATNVQFMADHSIQGFITLEAGHVAECAAERQVMSEKAKSPAFGKADDKEAWMHARSCGDDAMGFQAQGDATILQAASRMLGEGVRWHLVPIPDGVAVRLPYMRLWREHANALFEGHCTDSPDECRIMTHCTGGNGRTGMLLMSYFLDQLHQGKVVNAIAHGDSLNEYLPLHVNLDGESVQTRFTELRAEYYEGRFDSYDSLNGGACAQKFCNDRFIEDVTSRAHIPYTDEHNPAKLLARCYDACFICVGQGLSGPYQKPDAGGKPQDFFPGSFVPLAVMEAIVTVTLLRGIRAGEFFHVVTRSRPPGQCMRLVQWWECLSDPEFSINYEIPGWEPLRLDCKDPTPFAGNEFGIYTDWSKPTGLHLPANEAWGPEENPGRWQPTAYESYGVASPSGVQPGGASNAACPDDLQDTVECQLKAPDDQRAATASEPGMVLKNEASAAATKLTPAGETFFDVAHHL